MSLALHGHHILIIATLAFAAAVLTPSWYTASDLSIKRNIFDICTTYQYTWTCHWILLPTADNYLIRTRKKQKRVFFNKKKELYCLVLPVLAASFAIACAGTSLIGLILGSWYVHRFAGDIGSKWLLILTIISVFISCMFEYLIF